MDRNDKQNNDTEEIKSDLENSTQFLREKIKQRPINKRKLLRRTIITVSLAVVFGLVACITFLLLEPVINNRLYPEKEPAPVTFPEESASNEMAPEEMYADDDAIAADAASIATTSDGEVALIEDTLKHHVFSAEDYSNLYASLKAVASEAGKSLVTVTSVTSDTSWFDSFQESGSCSGLIVADTGTDTLILTNVSGLEDAESIRVTFCNSASVDASVKASDNISGLCILQVKDAALSEDTRNVIKPASLGSSNSGILSGTPVIAIGAPSGEPGSICYGNITGSSQSIGLADSNYRMISTDIYGSNKASGVLINLSGQVVGIINLTYNSSDLANQICAFGITECKSVIEDLSNASARPYLGIHGSSIPTDIQESMEIPSGVYVTQTDMNSPAMKAGIQSGDVITSIDGAPTASYEIFISKLMECSAGSDVSLTVMRQGPEGYIEMDMDAALAPATVSPKNNAQ